MFSLDEVVSIYTHEQVVCVWIRPAYSEQLHEIVKLTVNVTTDCHRTFLLVVRADGSCCITLESSLPLVAHSTRPGGLLLPVESGQQRLSYRSYVDSLDHTISKHPPLPIVCNSSGFLSILLVSGSTARR